MSIIRRPTSRDLNLLLDLYNYRVLTTSQIKRRYYPDSKTYVNKRLHLMRKSGYIATESYPRIDRKGFAYHQITDTGISLLREYGYDCPMRSDSLRVTQQMLPYLFDANEIMIQLVPYGWRMKDSRQVKHDYNMNRGDYIHGSLIAEDGTEYGFYVLENNTLAKNLEKIIQEIKTTSSYDRGLTDFIVFSKGRDSLNHFVERANMETRNHKGEITRTKLRPSGSLCVMPFKYALDYLKSKLTDSYFFEDVFRHKTAPAHWLSPSGKNSFAFIAEYCGEEVYVVNMLDSDLTKIDSIDHYLNDLQRLERFSDKKRKILVITEESLLGFHKELIGANDNIYYFAMRRKLITKTIREKAEMKGGY